MAITVKILIFHLITKVYSYYTCVPNSIFIQNGRSCYCDSLGRWTDDKCYDESRRFCMPGKVVWHGCTQCICQENGQLLCSDTECENTLQMTSVNNEDSSLGSSVLTSCTPLQYYYKECKICKCPASGITAQAECIPDNKCDIVEYETLEEFWAQSRDGVQLKCIPNVMYIFNCYNCLCPEKKYLLPNYCRNKCVQSSLVNKACLPKTLYKNRCNVCFCPETGISDDKLCTNNICDESIQSSLLRSKTMKCSPNSFTKPRCLYCECGYLTEESCIELDCLKPSEFNDSLRKTCSPGETVPVCIECFCLKNATTVQEYCTKSCSYQRKISILEKIMKDSFVSPELVEKRLVKRIIGPNCTPNTVYFDGEKYCLCPHNGHTSLNLCTSVMKEDMASVDSKFNKPQYEIKIDFNKTCKPNSFVEFDCNTCYCNKSGKIDPDWCTYDDCESMEIIQKSRNKTNADGSSETCIPGSISVVNCNFCICPNNGVLKDRSCTKNVCDSPIEPVLTDNLICEPLQYFLVDCNICFCPLNGEKNVDKCTKKYCDNNFLRSDYCSPGQLFSNGCNVCVCPSNGDKSDKVCTNKTCAEEVAAWKQIFTLSQHLLDVPYTDDTTRNLNLCFPGEEFVDGCKLCICPDMGFRDFASCHDMRCDEESEQDERSVVALRFQADLMDTRRYYEGNECYPMKYEKNTFNKKECIPGSLYIFRCQQCICPHLGSVNNFCRFLPKGTHCQQLPPYHNYFPMDGRISLGDENIPSFTTGSFNNQSIEYHSHTKYKCRQIGKLIDACFICDCIDNILVIEHCFKSDIPACKDVIPTFLNKRNETDNVYWLCFICVRPKDTIYIF